MTIYHAHREEVAALRQRAEAAEAEIAACHAYLDTVAPTTPDVTLLERIKRLVAERDAWEVSARTTHDTLLWQR